MLSTSESLRSKPPPLPWLGDNQFNWTTDAQGNIVYAGGLAPIAYEATNWRGGLPAGGWTMAATTLARVLSRLGTPSSPLSPRSEAQLLMNAYSFGTAGDMYSLGMNPLWAPAGNVLSSFNGFYPGTMAGAYRRTDSVVVVLLFNGELPGGFYSFIGELDAAVSDVAPTSWPTWDLFPFAP